ncbi:MAG: hypothetical protein U1F10_08630 [Burkholderiales bacterium]
MRLRLAAIARSPLRLAALLAALATWLAAGHNGAPPQPLLDRDRGERGRAVLDVPREYGDGGPVDAVTRSMGARGSGGKLHVR